MIKKLLFSWVFILSTIPLLVQAQAPSDGLLMKKRELCTLLQYSDGQWSEYWQGTQKRSNSNISTVRNLNVMLMSAYGITNRLNLMFALPWVRTSSDISYLRGQQGIQDLSLWLKWQPLTFQLGKGEFRVQTTGGLSTPTSDYIPDFLPFSIGLKSRTASLRAIAHYAAHNGLYATAQAGHTWRSSVQLNRDSYLYHDELIYSDEAPVPNWFDAMLRLGILKTKYQAELWAERATGLSGDDIRYNDGPMVTNKMQATTVGAWAKYWITTPMAIQAGASYVVQGRNVGQTFGWNAGVFYLINTKK